MKIRMSQGVTKVLRIKSRMSMKSLFSRMFVSFILLLTIFALVITLLLFAAFSKSSTQQFNEIAAKSLEQRQGILENIIHQARMICFQLSLDNEVIQLLNTPDNTDTPYVITAINRKLKDLLFTNDSIDSIYLYNGTSKLIMSSNFYADVELKTVDWVRESNIVSLGKVIPRLIEFPAGRQEMIAHEVYSMIYYDRFEDSGEVSSMIILNMKADQRTNTIGEHSNGSMTPQAAELSQSSGLAPARGDFLVVDEHGMVVSAAGDVAFLQDLSGESYVEKIRSVRAAGSFTDMTSFGKTLITYNYSETLGWYFISVIPYDTATANLTSLRNSAIFICILLILTGFIIVAVLSGILSLPFSRLAKKVRGFSGHAAVPLDASVSDSELLNRFYANIVTEFEGLDRIKQTFLSSMKNEYLRDVLYGIRKPREEDVQEYRLRISTHHIEQAKIVRLQLNRTGTEELDHKAGTVVYRFAENFMSESGTAFEIVRIGSDILLFLVLDQPDDTSDYMHLLQQLLSGIVRQYGVKVTLSVGDSFEQATTASLYKLVYGTGEVLHYDTIMKRLNGNFEYPFLQQKGLTESIKLGKTERIEPLLDELFQIFKLFSYPMILLSINQLLFAVLAAGESSLPEQAKLGRESKFSETLELLQQMESLDEMKGWFLHYMTGLVQRSVESKQNQKSILTAEIAAYIESNYWKPELSVEVVASHFQYNAVYFGRLFKELFNQLFLDYLTELRISKANQYLCESQIPVKEVGKKVGFLNASYFVTWYKRHTGCAPTEFRKQHKRSIQ